ncbi:MAG: ABC transporter substrate-binding protein [Anaerolineaceae bacterium]|nr:ABC transporter substrate-binding protein [Anaerolineaceae bacterium]
MKHKILLVVSLLIAMSMIFSACQPAAGEPETITIIETVEVEGEMVEREVVVTATPEEVAPMEYTSKDPETWVFATFGDVDTLDPWIQWDSASAEIITNVYDSLLWYDREKMSELVPQLAEEVPSQENGGISEDGLTYTFKIREGVTFHDGSELLATDAAFTIIQGLLKADVNTPAQLYLEPIMGVGIVDITMLEQLDASGDLGLMSDQEAMAEFAAANPEAIVAVCEDVQSRIVGDNDAMTLTITLEQPWGAFLDTVVYGWGAIQSEAWLKANGSWDGDCATWPQHYGVTSDVINASPLGSTAMGTGPFMLESWIPGEEIVLKANENYWRTEPAYEGGAVGAPALKTVIKKQVDEFNTRLAMLQAGDADQITLGSQSDYTIMDEMVGEICTADGRECEVVGDGFLRKMEGIQSGGRTDVYFNFDVNTDSNFVGSGELDGNGVPYDFFSDVHIRRGFAYAFDYEAYLNDVMLGLGVRSKGVMLPGMIGYSEDIPFYDYDLVKAEEEFRASTWTAADGTSLWDTGFRLTAAYNTGNDQRQSISEIIQANISAINPNFVIEVTSLPWPTYLDAIRTGKMPIFIVGWGSDFYDSHNWTGIYTNAYYGHRQNLPDDLMAEYADINGRAAIEADPVARAAIYADEFNQKFYDTCHGLILHVPLLNHYEPRYVNGYYGNDMHESLWYRLSKD